MSGFSRVQSQRSGGTSLSQSPHSDALTAAENELKSIKTQLSTKRVELKGVKKQAAGELRSNARKTSFSGEKTDSALQSSILQETARLQKPRLTRLSITKKALSVDEAREKAAKRALKGADNSHEAMALVTGQRGVTSILRLDVAERHLSSAGKKQWIRGASKEIMDGTNHRTVARDLHDTITVDQQRLNALGGFNRESIKHSFKRVFAKPGTVSPNEDVSKARAAINAIKAAEHTSPEEKSVTLRVAAQVLNPAELKKRTSGRAWTKDAPRDLHAAATAYDGDMARRSHKIEGLEDKVETLREKTLDKSRLGSIGRRITKSKLAGAEQKLARATLKNEILAVRRDAVIDVATYAQRQFTRRYGADLSKSAVVKKINDHVAEIDIDTSGLSEKHEKQVTKFQAKIAGKLGKQLPKVAKSDRVAAWTSITPTGRVRSDQAARIARPNSSIQSESGFARGEVTDRPENDARDTSSIHSESSFVRGQAAETPDGAENATSPVRTASFIRKRNDEARFPQFGSESGSAPL